MDGTVEEFDLVENGGNIPLTNENKQLYVQKVSQTFVSRANQPQYVDYMLNVSISKQFESFKRGFLLVSGGHVLNVCHCLFTLIILFSSCALKSWKSAFEDR